MLQYEIARITVPPVPAALTLAGPNPNFGPPNSANFGISGTEDPSCSSAGGAVPAIGTTTDVGNSQTGASATQVASLAASSIATTLQGPGVKTQNFTGAGCTATQGGDDVQNVINVAPSYSTVAGLNAVVQSVIGAADIVTSNPSTITNYGQPISGVAVPQTIAITGNADVSGLSGGSGILLVTGNMVASGNFSWNGTILVIGTGSVTFNGGGGGSLNGAVVVANIALEDHLHDYASNPSEANLASALGSPTFNFNGGGGNFLQYNSCLTTASTAHSTFKVLARREIVY